MQSTTEPKVTRLPEKEDMLARLISVNDDSHAVEQFYPLILKDAGRELVGSGVVLMLHLAIHDYTEGMPPFMGALIQMSLKGYVEALIDDPEVKADALQFIDQVDANVKETIDSQPPTPARHELSEDDKTTLMRSIKHLAEVYDACADDPNNVSEEYRAGGANSFYDQTRTGLYLEFYYGGPSKVWTPWGSWHFGAAQRYQFDLDKFMARLTVREHIAQHNTNMGTIGPVYALLAIDGEALPEPSLLEDRRQHMSHAESKAEWARLFGAN